MVTAQSTSVASARINMLKSVALLLVALLPWPQGWTRVRSVIASARSPELNRAEREVQARQLLVGRQVADTTRD